MERIVIDLNGKNTLELVVGEIKNLRHWEFINSNVNINDIDMADIVNSQIDTDKYIAVTNLHAVKGCIVIIDKKKPVLKISESLTPFGLLVGKCGSNIKHIEKDNNLINITVSE